MVKLKIFSFFSGSGFLDLGFEMAGYAVDLVNEFSSAFINAYKYSRNGMHLPTPKYGYYNIDVNEFLTVRSDDLRRCISDARQDNSLVGFIGGPPCPDFSVAGKQRGRNGDNGKLSQSYIDLIIAQQPDFFLFENVKGLWRTAKHRAYYDELKALLSEAGYYMTDRLTNSLEFGAPQDRDRILLFGLHKRLVNPNNSNPLHCFEWEKYMKYVLDDVKGKPWSAAEPFVAESQTQCPPNIPVELTVQYWFDKNDVENHPNAVDCFVPRSGLQRMLTVDEGDDSKKSYKRLHRWRYSPTVAYGNNEVHLHPYKPRRLTVAEALSLQSLPKDFVLPPDMSLTDKFKTTGNGVPFLLANGIAKTIADFLRGGTYRDEDNCL
ncbi:MAG: DNA cytosine methyltransferase [Christensenella sp.]